MRVVNFTIQAVTPNMSGVNGANETNWVRNLGAIISDILLLTNMKIGEFATWQ